MLLTSTQKNHTLIRVKKLLTYFRAGKIPTLAQHEVHPDLALGSRENYLYFTLPVCINFQRSSPAMWQSAYDTYKDLETHDVFFPEWVVETSRSDIQDRLIKHRLALQTNKHTDIWIAICKTLHKFFDDDPREIIAAADNDVLKLLHILQTSHKKQFPYLSGPKLSNYWPFILSEYTDISLRNPHEISIIPDTHVIKSSIHLGLVSAKATSLQIVAVWKELLDGSTITPVEMHPVLWNWSRAGFVPDV